MAKCSVTRRVHFNAAHRLHNPAFSDDWNRETFGPCNNPNYHGHNYELIVSVTGEIHKETGFVMDMKELKTIIREEVEDQFDHRNLNEEVEEFRTLNPTAENIVVVIWDKIRKRIPAALQLEVTLYETPRNFVSYDGN